MTEQAADMLVLPAELSALVRLRSAGFRLTAVRNDKGDVTRVDGIRVIPDPFQPDADWVEVVTVNSATDAKGLRQNPDDETVWLREGSVVDVVDGFLDLPKPGAPGAPSLVISRGEKLWTL
jgi:hypothetical protein